MIIKSRLPQLHYWGSFSLMLAGTVLSCILTVIYLHDLGEDSGFPPQLFAAIGVLFDLTKAFIPLFIVFVWKKSKPLAILSGTLCSVLILISFFASMSAFEGSFEAKKREATSMSNDALIEALKSQIKVIESHLESQTSVRQVSKADGTKDDLLPLYEKLNQAIANNVPHVEENPALAGAREYISAAFSVCLELLVVVLSFWCATNIGSVIAVPQGGVPEKLRAQDVQSDSCSNDELQSQCYEKTSELDPPLQLERLNVQATDEIAIREKIIAGRLKPSYRSIGAAYSIGQAGIKAILHQLIDDGYLQKTANGFELVASA